MVLKSLVPVPKISKLFWFFSPNLAVIIPSVWGLSKILPLTLIVSLSKFKMGFYHVPQRSLK